MEVVAGVVVESPVSPLIVPDLAVVFSASPLL
jgi:hypothetical protein